MTLVDIERIGTTFCQASGVGLRGRSTSFLKTTHRPPTRHHTPGDNQHQQHHQYHPTHAATTRQLIHSQRPPRQEKKSAPERLCVTISKVVVLQCLEPVTRSPRRNDWCLHRVVISAGMARHHTSTTIQAYQSRARAWQAAVDIPSSREFHQNPASSNYHGPLPKLNLDILAKRKEHLLVGHHLDGSNTQNFQP